MDRSRFIRRRNEKTADPRRPQASRSWRCGGGTCRPAPIGHAGLFIAVLALALTSHRTLANWYGQYIGSGTCTPIDHISIGSNGAVTVIHDLGKLRTPEDFANALQRLGLELKPQTTADNTKIQIYSATEGTHTVNFTFKFFADQKACLADADASLGLPSGVEAAEPSSSPSASPKIQQPVVTPPPLPAPAPAAETPISPPPLLPKAAPIPTPAKIWIIVVLLGNDPTGAPLSRFYRTKQDCLMGIAAAENDPLIRRATRKGRFKLDCMQLTEADQERGEIGPARFSAHRVPKSRHHSAPPRLPIEIPALSNEPPPSERSPPSER
jgi:hypothetical protein